MNDIIKNLSIFLISLLTLLFEFLQIRIFSFQHWYYLAYFIITMSLLGIAIGGALIASIKALKNMAEIHFYSFCFFGLAASISLSTFLVSCLSKSSMFLWQGNTDTAYVIIAYTLAAIPYIFFGMAMARAWSDYSLQAALIYFFNLTGSALGIICFMVLLSPLGAENLIRLIVIVSLLLALPFFRQAIFNFRISAKVLLAIILLLTLGVAVKLFILPDRNKLYWTLFDGNSIFKEWNPVARVDVMQDSAGRLTILNDGDAQTPLNFYTNYHRLLVYAARGYDQPLGSVLVIGSGGGADVAWAYKYGSQDIDAIEVNPTTNRLVKKEFADIKNSIINDNVFKQSAVHLFEAEGRSFIKKTAKKYDIIMLMGVDNLAASDISAYAMTENYPYTLEAFKDYWVHLSDNGFIQISRFYYPQTPRETLRVFTTFYEALKSQGVDEPEKHLLVVVNTDNVSNPFGTVLVSKMPVDDSIISGVSQWFNKDGSALNLGFLFPKLSPNINQHGYDVFQEYIASQKNGQSEDFYKNYFFDIRPSTDDRPFFFQNWKLSNIFNQTDSSAYEKYFNNLRGRPLFILFALLAQSSLIVLCLLTFSFISIKKKIRDYKDLIYSFTYFSIIGISFMFLEMPLIQKLIIYLGHPIYSLAIIMPALFFGLALGSLFSSRINPRQQYLMMLSLITIILAIVFLFNKNYLDFLLYENRTVAMAVVFSLVAIVGFFAGVFFPGGITRLAKTNDLISFVWVANSGFSVIGSILAIGLAMLFGFNLVLFLSAGFYLSALLIAIVWQKYNQI